MSRLLTLEISAAWLASGAIVAISDATIGTVVVSLCAAIPPTIVAWAALRAAGRAAEATKDTAAKVDETDKKAVVILEKAAEIHTATNGHLSKLTAEVSVANQEIKGLKDLVASMTASAKTAEQIATQAAPVAAVQTKPADCV